MCCLQPTTAAPSLDAFTQLNSQSNRPTLLQDKNAGSPANSPGGSPLRDRKATVSGADVV